MNARRLFIALLVSLLSTESQTQQLETIMIEGREAVAGELIIKLKPQNAAVKTPQVAAKANLLRQCGAMIKTEWMTGTELWKVNQEDMERVLGLLKNNPLVDYVYPNYMCVKGTGNPGIIPNDPEFNKQWHLLNTGQNGGKPGADIRATDAWTITAGDSTVVVAVLDSGVDIDHPDLKKNIWVNKREIPGNGIDDDGNGFIDDVNGWDFIANDNNPRAKGNSHGTAVAGLIAAVQNNGIGVSGVAPFVKIMPVRLLDSTATGTVGSALSAYEYAIKAGAKILNCSFGADYHNPAEEDMLRVANDRDILVVAAAGNIAQDLDRMVFVRPASVDLPNIVAVGASNNLDNLSSFSSYGQNVVAIVAPGDATYTTSMSGGYTFFSGTSASAPVASGVAALIRSAFPNLTAAQVRQQMILSSDLASPSLYKRSLSNGRVNAYKAVQGLYFTPFQLSPKSVNFGIQKIGTTGTERPVILKNPSNDPLTIDSLIVTPGFSFSRSDSMVRTLRGVRVAARDSVAVNMYFTPSAAAVHEGVFRMYHKNTYGQLVVLQSSLQGQGIREGTPVLTRNVSGRWTKQDSPYLISNDVEVSGELVIDPGAKIIFGGPFFLACTDNNRLIVKGTPTDSVLLTAENQQVGWSGIVLFKTMPGNVIFEYTNIQYAKTKPGDILVGGITRNRWGGAIASKESSPIIRNCRFSENTCDDGGGGAISIVVGRPVIENCLFRNNVAHTGAISFSYGETGIYNNLLLVNNRSNSFCSAFYFSGGTGFYTINNSTVYGNASCNNTISIGVEVRVVFNNSIFYKNTAGVLAGVGWIYGGRPAELAFNYCDVDTSSVARCAEAYPADYGMNKVTWGPGSFAADPKFVDAAAGDFRLAPNSPAIDAGTPDPSGLGLDPTDFAGNDRIANGRIDLGVYEMAANAVRVPLPPLVVLPLDNSTKIPVKPTLLWSKADRARTYRLQVSLSQSFAAPLVHDSEVDVDTMQTIGPLLNSTTYYWRVSAANNSGVSAWSQVRQFTTTSVTAAPQPSALVSPLNGSSSRSLISPSPTFKWTPSAGAQTHRLQISTHFEYWVKPYLVFDSAMAGTEKSVNLPPGATYYWRVAAEGEGGIAWSQVANFMSVVMPPPPPLLWDPSDSAKNVNIAPFMRWAGMLADRYHLQVSTVPTFASTVVDDSTSIGTGQYCLLPSPGTLYYWRVRACNAAGWSAFSVTRTFTTASTGPVPSQVNLWTPGDGAKNVQTYESIQAYPLQDAITYHLQIATDSLLSVRIVDDSSLTSPSLSAGKLPSGTRYFWRMRAKNVFGWGLYSPVWRFTTVMATPGLLAPADCAINLQLTTTLSWNAVSGATGYQLDVSTAQTFSPLTLSDSVITTSSRTVGPLSLNTTYFWRVRARNDVAWGNYSLTRWFSTIRTTSVEQVGSGIPTEYGLSQNYPNPFNPSTTIQFDLPKSGFVSLKVFDLLGREAATLISEELDAGYYRSVWKANVPSGVYFYHIQAGEFSQTKRLVLLK